MTSSGTVEGDERVRLFLAFELPADVTMELVRWGKEHLSHGRPVTSFHITFAFLGRQPRTALEPIIDVLRREAATTEPFVLGPVRYRETRSVGMLVLADPSGRATALAERVQIGLEQIDVYERERRPWLPHVTVLRFRERPRLSPPLPELRPFVPSGAAALLSRLHPTGARYEVLESYALDTEHIGHEHMEHEHQVRAEEERMGP